MKVRPAGGIGRRMAWKHRQFAFARRLNLAKTPSNLLDFSRKLSRFSGKSARNPAISGKQIAKSIGISGNGGLDGTAATHVFCGFSQRWDKSAFTEIIAYSVSICPTFWLLLARVPAGRRRHPGSRGDTLSDADMGDAAFAQSERVSVLQHHPADQINPSTSRAATSLRPSDGARDQPALALSISPRAS